MELESEEALAGDQSGAGVALSENYIYEEGGTYAFEDERGCAGAAASESEAGGA